MTAVYLPEPPLWTLPDPIARLQGRLRSLERRERRAAAVADHLLRAVRGPAHPDKGRALDFPLVMTVISHTVADLYERVRPTAGRRALPARRPGHHACLMHPRPFGHTPRIAPSMDDLGLEL
jgi:hypothetical protein